MNQWIKNLPAEIWKLVPRSSLAAWNLKQDFFVVRSIPKAGNCMSKIYFNTATIVWLSHLLNCVVNIDLKFQLPYYKMCCFL